jgi:hypothetical protein
MTRDEIIKLAREAGLPLAWISEEGVLRWSELVHFAALVAAAEREACAKVCENNHTLIADSLDGYDIAVAIRARGEK